MTKSITKHIKTKLKNCRTYTSKSCFASRKGENILILTTTTPTNADLTTDVKLTSNVRNRL